MAKVKHDILKDITPKSIKYTHAGHKLTITEFKFISKYVELGDVNAAAKEAGYSLSGARAAMRKDYIIDEIRYKLDDLSNENIADAKEILEYLTSVMRGEVKDQFGLDAPLSERTKAAQELAKRKIDNEVRVNKGQNAEIKVTLDWDR